MGQPNNIFHNCAFLQELLYSDMVERREDDGSGGGGVLGFLKKLREKLRRKARGFDYDKLTPLPPDQVLKIKVIISGHTLRWMVLQKS